MRFHYTDLDNCHTAEEFTWSPGGRKVAYHSRKTGKWGVWIMTAG
jgi:hypothetical protein